MKLPDFIIQCRKCGHEVYITGGATMTGKEIAKKAELDCPECGEEYYENWRIVGLGNFEKR